MSIHPSELIAELAANHSDETPRLEALHALRLMDTPPEERFDRVVRLAQRLFDVPMVAVNLVDQDRLWVKAAVGLGTTVETPRCDSFCDHAIRQSEPLLISDARLDDRFLANQAVTGDPHIRFYAGQPLRAPGGQRVGALCIIDHEPRELSQRDVGLLRDLADWVEKEMATDRELVAARDVQRRLLPRTAPDVPGYDIAGRCVPASEVGGDFYDWYPIDDAFQVVIADVMGKGVPAAIIAASVRALLRGASRFNPVHEALNRASFSIERDLLDTSTFVTLFCARLDPKTGRVDYVDAGHGLSVVMDADGGHRRLVSDGLPLGALSEDRWTSHATVLLPGDTLVAVSDGFLDFFDSPEEALQAALQANEDSPTGQDLADLLTALCADGFTADDVTVLVVRRETLLG